MSAQQLLGNGYIAGAGDTLVPLFLAESWRFVGSDLLSSSAGFAVKPRQALGPNGALPLVTDAGRRLGAELSGDESWRGSAGTFMSKDAKTNRALQTDRQG